MPHDHRHQGICDKWLAGLPRGSKAGNVLHMSSGETLPVSKKALVELILGQRNITGEFILKA
jgi:hypothetical protein